MRTEIHPRIAKALVLAHLDHVALGVRERVFKEHDDRVRSCPMRAGACRSVRAGLCRAGSSRWRCVADRIGRLLRAARRWTRGPPSCSSGLSRSSRGAIGESGITSLDRRRGRAQPELAERRKQTCSMASPVESTSHRSVAAASARYMKTGWPGTKFRSPPRTASFLRANSCCAAVRRDIELDTDTSIGTGKGVLQRTLAAQMHAAPSSCGSSGPRTST